MACRTRARRTVATPLSPRASEPAWARTLPGWTFVAPYLALVSEDAPQRHHHDQREVFNGLRWVVRTGSPDRGYAAFWHPFMAHLYSALQYLVIAPRQRTGFFGGFRVL